MPPYKSQYSAAAGRVESEHALVGIERSMRSFRLLQKRRQQEAGDEAADVGPPGNAGSGRWREQIRGPLHHLDQKPEPGKTIAGNSKKNGKNRIGIITTTRESGNMRI